MLLMAVTLVDGVVLAERIGGIGMGIVVIAILFLLLAQPRRDREERRERIDRSPRHRRRGGGAHRGPRDCFLTRSTARASP